MELILSSDFSHASLLHHLLFKAFVLLKANFEIPIISDIVIHLLQNGGEEPPADQAEKMKLVG